MNNYIIRIEVQEGRVKEILDEMTEAQATIYRCWEELEHLGVAVIKKAPSKEDDAGRV